MLMLLIEIFTVGFPFCAFKIVGGILFAQDWLFALGLVDVFFNAVNFFSLLILKKRLLDTCFLSFLVRLIKKPRPGRKTKWEDFGNSLDVLFSFLLVAYVIGGGFIPKLTPQHLSIWNMAVILNVIGAGSGRMSASIQNLKVQ
jgi:hypothetical protein